MIKQQRYRNLRAILLPVALSALGAAPATRAEAVKGIVLSPNALPLSGTGLAA